MNIDLQIKIVKFLTDRNIRAKIAILPGKSVEVNRDDMVMMFPRQAIPEEGSYPATLAAINAEFGVRLDWWGKTDDVLFLDEV